MAEFRKREDINQELDILQHWSEMGAPRMGDVSRSLQSLVKTVDPRLMGELEPSGLEMTVSSEPPEFADLPPGEEEEDDERPRRRWLLPLIAAMLVAGAGALALLSRWETTPEPSPTPEPSDEDMTEIPPEATRAPSLTPTMQPSVMATPQPSPTPTLAPTPSARPTEAPTPGVLPTAAAPTASVAPTPEARPTPDQTRPMAPAAPKTRVVQPGDSLSAIAVEEYGSADRWTEIYEANRDQVTVPDVIEPGMSLRIPAADPGEPAAQAPSGPALQGVETFVYTVQPGDSLSLIAMRHLGSAQRWSEIYYLNSHQIANPNWIFPGQRLQVPKAAGRVVTRYVVRTGDTLWAIAGKTMQDPNDWPKIYQANQYTIRNQHLIYPGQTFEVPR